VTNRGVVKTFMIAALALLGATAIVSAQAVTVVASQQNGAEALVISGNAPARSPVRVSLSAQLSPDLPVVDLGTTEVEAGSNGRYATTRTIAPDYGRGSMITVRVSSAAGGDATTTWVVGAPNPGVPAEIQ